MYFFVIPDDDTTYAIHSTNANKHKNARIFWKMGTQTNTSMQRNGQRSIVPNLHIVNVNTFRDPILVVEDYTITELECNMEYPMVTVVLPFAMARTNNFMSSYKK